MSQGIVLLDEALDLARREKTALEDGEYDQAIELAEKRSRLTGMAWNMLSGRDVDSFKKRLTELYGLQNQLGDLAKRARDVIRQQLSRSRLEKKRINGYHRAVEQALQ